MHELQLEVKKIINAQHKYKIIKVNPRNEPLDTKMSNRVYPNSDAVLITYFKQ